MKKNKSLIALSLAFVLFNACKEKKATTQKFIETANMDSSVKPGDDFFLYVNGK